MTCPLCLVESRWARCALLCDADVSRGISVCICRFWGCGEGVILVEIGERDSLQKVVSEKGHFLQDQRGRPILNTEESLILSFSHTMSVQVL